MPPGRVQWCNFKRPEAAHRPVARALRRGVPERELPPESRRSLWQVSGFQARLPARARAPPRRPGRSFATYPPRQASNRMLYATFRGICVSQRRVLEEHCVVTTMRIVRHAGVALVLAASLITLGACGEGAGSTLPEQPPAPLLLSPDDLLSVSESALASGPLITGSVEAERRADLRAEVSAVVLEVLKENGDPVRRGDLLVRLDPTAIRDALTSAEASARAAELAYEQAERQYQRILKLREENLVSAQQLEDAEVRRNSAQSEAEAARTRVVAARQQLERTEVRAPFDGLVSNRKVSAGDTASVGKELMQVMDPASMRFEGRVSADSIGEV